MKRHRPFLGLLLALGTGLAAFSLCFWLGSRARSTAVDHGADDLSWLGHEFHLSAAELAQIRPLHHSYQLKCEEMCAQLAVKNQELAATLKGTNQIGPEVERKLLEIATLRAECQAQMLRHFQTVAQTMPGTQGQRYLEVMQRLTLGVPGSHEHSMSHSMHETR